MCAAALASQTPSCTCSDGGEQVVLAPRAGPRPGGGAMTVSQERHGEAGVLAVLLDANVQFVVVGEPRAQEALRLVVSRHPTNLDALGKALARMDAALRTPGPPVPGTPGTAHGAGAGTSAPGARRIGDPLGTVPVTARGVDLELLFGGPHHSLYAETLAVASDREIAGRRVQWAAAPARLGPPDRTGGALERRLLSIAERLAHLVERDDEPPAGGGDSGD